MTTRSHGYGQALARAALAGNPSDGYGGAVLAVTLPAWAAQARALAAERLTIRPSSQLVEAAVRRFAAELEPRALASAVDWQTAIPLEVGLASSSALVIAVIRALCQLYGVELGPERLAFLALAVETEELGIAAGPQDRIAQAHGGLTFMDFAAGSYEPMDRELLPPLLIGWRPDASGHSGPVHTALAARYRQGDPVVRHAMARLAAAARSAKVALLEGDMTSFGRCVDATFELRRRLMPLDPQCVDMVQAARRHGAAANYTGSGGAIVAVSTDRRRLEAVRTELDRLGCSTGWPTPAAVAAT